MDGLEATMLLKSTLQQENKEFRIDSEFFEKQYLDIYNKLVGQKMLGELTTMHDVSSNGSFAYVQNILKTDGAKEIPYIRSGNVGETFINQDDLICISKEAHDKLPLSKTKLYDIMVARKEKIGGATIITDSEINFNCNENVIKLTIKDKDLYDPFYVTEFLNSKFGKKQLARISKGNVQPWVSIYQIRKIKCFYVEKKLQGNIRKLILCAYERTKFAKELYSFAEKLFLQQLTFPDSNIAKELIAIKKYSDSFSISGRLDAEYYQPKYDELFASLSKQKTRLLGGKSGIVTIKKSIEPGNDVYCDEGIPFVRVSDITKFGISNPVIKLPKDVVPNVTSLYPKKDTILFSKDGNVGITYKVEKDLEVITSGALLHLTVKNQKEILPDYLTLVLNSKVVQLQAERDSNGATT